MSPRVKRDDFPSFAEPSLSEEANAIAWIYEEVRSGRPLPVAEAEVVVRSLALTMHGEDHLFVPLLQHRVLEEHAAAHALNVAVLTMALGETLGFSAADVRTVGFSALLHDIGMTRVPLEILHKPEALTVAERDIVRRHPIEGARIIIETGEPLELAAIVAYEHHITADGNGYPRFIYPRACHYASKLVQTCAVFNALRTPRASRDAWPLDKVLEYLHHQAGREFEPEFVHAFTGMIRSLKDRLVILDEGGFVTPTQMSRRG